MKSSKHVETCFVRANDDFDDKLTYIYCFLNKKKLLDKNPQKRTLCTGKEMSLEATYILFHVKTMRNKQILK